MDLIVFGQFGKHQMKGVVSSSNVRMLTQTIPAYFVERLNVPEFAEIRSYYCTHVQPTNSYL